MFLVFWMLICISAIFADSHDPFHEIHITQNRENFSLTTAYAPLNEIIEQVCWVLKHPCRAVNIKETVTFAQQSFNWAEWIKWLKDEYAITYHPNHKTFSAIKKVTTTPETTDYLPIYQKPSSLVKRYYKIWPKSSTVTIKADDDANQLLVWFKAGSEKEILQRFRQLDCQTPHIFTKIDIIAVEHQAFNQLDIDLMGAWTQFSKQKNPSIGLLSKMKALESKGQASLLAKPTTMLLPKQKMNIKNTEKTKGIGQPATLSLTMSFDFHGRDGILADIELKHIYPNGDHFIENHFKNAVLLINKEPTLIGGLRENKEQQTTDCLPLIGDIPIIGNLFCNSSTHKNDQIILIFIHPERIQRCNNMQNY